MCEQGTNIKVIQDVLGHKDIETTMDIYTDATMDLKAKEIGQLQDCFGLAMWYRLIQFKPKLKPFGTRLVKFCEDLCKIETAETRTVEGFWGFVKKYVIPQVKIPTMKPLEK